MSGVVATKNLTDATGSSFPVNMIDESGTGIGPYTPRHAPVAGTTVEHSGSIAAAGTSQQLMAANTARKRLIIQNPSTAAGQGGIAAAENLYIRFGTNAAGVDNGTSYEIAPGGSYDSGSGPCPTDAIQVVATTINHKFIASELV